MTALPLARQRIARHASCPTCDLAVIATGSKCPWCDTPLTPPDTVEHTMDRALESTTLFHLTFRSEPTR